MSEDILEQVERTIRQRARVLAKLADETRQKDKERYKGLEVQSQTPSPGVLRMHQETLKYHYQTNIKNDREEEARMVMAQQQLVEETLEFYNQLEQISESYTVETPVDI